MEAEQLSMNQVDASKKAIARANSLINSMKDLKKKLHLSDGCGQRFLQKTHPDLALLQQAEQEITAQYSGSSTESQKNNTKSKTELLNNLARRGQA